MNPPVGVRLVAGSTIVRGWEEGGDISRALAMKRRASSIP